MAVYTGREQVRKDIKVRCWTITSYDTDLDWLEIWETGLFTYMAYGEEKCPETGRDHRQGWVRFKNPRKDVKLVSKIFNSAHVEKMKGTPEQNRIYCTKEMGAYWEKGHFPRQGERTDIQRVMEEVKKGATELEIAESHMNLWCQYGRRFEAYRRLLEVERQWKTDIRVYWGPAESGKSKNAREWLGTYDTVDYTRGGFFIGYKGNENIILDDFEGQCTMEKKVFMNMADRYPLIVNVKGGERNWAPKRIAITSNTNPETWYPSQKVACMRRINKVIKMGGTEEVQGNTFPVPVRKTHQKRCRVSSCDD